LSLAFQVVRIRSVIAFRCATRPTRLLSHETAGSVPLANHPTLKYSKNRAHVVGSGSVSRNTLKASIIALIGIYGWNGLIFVLCSVNVQLKFFVWGTRGITTIRRRRAGGPCCAGEPGRPFAPGLSGNRADSRKARAIRRPVEALFENETEALTRRSSSLPKRILENIVRTTTVHGARASALPRTVAAATGSRRIC
jgi:hypothetical protein